MQYDARYTQRHINTLQYGARYTQRQIRVCWHYSCEKKASLRKDIFEELENSEMQYSKSTELLDTVCGINHCTVLSSTFSLNLIIFFHLTDEIKFYQ